MNKHEGHEVTYNERGLTEWNFTITKDGNIKLDQSTRAMVDVEESFLFCDTCGYHVSGKDLGISDCWEAE